MFSRAKNGLINVCSGHRYGCNHPIGFYWLSYCSMVVRSCYSAVLLLAFISDLTSNLAAQSFYWSSSVLPVCVVLPVILPFSYFRPTAVDLTGLTMFVAPPVATRTITRVSLWHFPTLRFCFLAKRCPQRQAAIKRHSFAVHSFIIYNGKSVLPAFVFDRPILYLDYRRALDPRQFGSKLWIFCCKTFLPCDAKNTFTTRTKRLRANGSATRKVTDHKTSSSIWSGLRVLLVQERRKKHPFELREVQVQFLIRNFKISLPNHYRRNLASWKRLPVDNKTESIDESLRVIHSLTANFSKNQSDFSNRLYQYFFFTSKSSNLIKLISLLP